MTKWYCARPEKPPLCLIPPKVLLIVDYVYVYDNGGDLGDSGRGNTEEPEWSIYQEGKMAQDDVTQTII